MNTEPSCWLLLILPHIFHSCMSIWSILIAAFPIFFSHCSTHLFSTPTHLLTNTACSKHHPRSLRARSLAGNHQTSEQNLPLDRNGHHDSHHHQDQGPRPLPHLHLHQFSALPKRWWTALYRATVHHRKNDDHRLRGRLLPQEDSHRHGAVPLRADLQDRVCDHGGGDQDGGMLVA